MKNTIKTWMECRHRIKIEDVKGENMEGYVEGYDEVGIVLQSNMRDVKSITLFPWTSIYKIVRC